MLFYAGFVFNILLMRGCSGGGASSHRFLRFGCRTALKSARSIWVALPDNHPGRVPASCLYRLRIAEAGPPCDLRIALDLLGHDGGDAPVHVGIGFAIVETPSAIAVFDLHQAGQIPLRSSLPVAPGSAGERPFESDRASPCAR